MPIRRRDVARGLAVVSAILLFALLSAGCELAVEDNGARDDVQRTALTTGFTVLPEYDAAVSAIDFDPPLGAENLVASGKTVKLLAAIENKGTMPLSDLTVEASLITQSGGVAARERSVLDKLSPGETRVVEFRGVASADSLPKSPSYRIQVTVEGSQGGANSVSSSRQVMVRVVN